MLQLKWGRLIPPSRRGSKELHYSSSWRSIENCSKVPWNHMKPYETHDVLRFQRGHGTFVWYSRRFFSLVVSHAWMLYFDLLQVVAFDWLTAGMKKLLDANNVEAQSGFECKHYQQPWHYVGQVARPQNDFRIFEGHCNSNSRQHAYLEPRKRHDW